MFLHTVKEEKIPKYITNGIEISSDESDEDSNGNNYVEEWFKNILWMPFSRAILREQKTKIWS